MSDEVRKTFSKDNMVIFPTESFLNNKILCYDINYSSGKDILLINNDIEDVIGNIPKNTINLIISSPPYNIGKPYEKKKKFNEYLEWNKCIINKLIECLSDKGSLCWEIGNYVKDGEVFPLDYYFYEIFKEFNLKLRNRIIWNYGHGYHASRKFSGRYEILLWFTKTDDYIFNLDNVREPQKYPGKIAYKGKKKGKPSGNPKGKNPSDVWSIIQNDWDREIWYIPNVKARHVEKTIHTCQFPIALIERLILALTNKNDIVFDPFVGVGSSMIAAIKNNRNVIGVDREKIYTDIAFKRINDYFKGTLKIRPIEKPIWVPNGNEKVAKVPEEWKNKPLWKNINDIL